MKNVKLLLAVILAICAVNTSLPARTWTEAKTGRTVEGEFRKLNGEDVEILRSNGTLLKLPLAMLSDEDKKFVAESQGTDAIAQTAAETPKATHKNGEKLQVNDVIDISFRSVNAGKVDLAEMKGKVVLLDFWATWCGPCIAELPNVKEAYEEYHGKGFEIVGISLDSDKSRLKDFIKENGMTWPQHFDGNGWKNKLAVEYGIRSIPSAFLVKDNKVVATDVRGDALQEQLKELLR